MSGTCERCEERLIKRETKINKKDISRIGQRVEKERQTETDKHRDRDRQDLTKTDQWNK